MTTSFIELEAVRGFRVTCNSCGLDEEYRTKHAAEYKADLHEIKYLCHEASVSIRDTKALED